MVTPGEDTPGWSVPVSHAIASPQTLLVCGVPQVFFLVNLCTMAMVIALGNFLAGVLLWKLTLVSGALHLVTMLGTAREVQWAELWWRYRSYATRYEG
jgi:type IV secretory pathway TrbD component